MFGKDTSYCDSFGFVSDLEEQHVTKAALGKAHCVALNTRGEVITFGLNNKNQCGRIFGLKGNEIIEEDGDQKRKKNQDASESDDMVNFFQLIVVKNLFSIS